MTSLTAALAPHGCALAPPAVSVAYEGDRYVVRLNDVVVCRDTREQGARELEQLFLDCPSIAAGVYSKAQGWRRAAFSRERDGAEVGRG